MKLENKNNKILDDLNTRNDNWEKLDGIPEKVTDLETNQDTIKQETELKVAKVEKDLQDYKATINNINTNQEATQVAQGYGVVNLPKTAANGQVSVSLRGQSATNIIKNHNFKDGSSNWGNSNSTNTIENGLLVNTSLASQYPALIQDTNIDCATGKKIFARAIVTVIGSPTSISLNLRGATSTSGFQQFQAILSANININTQYELKGIVAINSGQVGKVRISAHHNYADAVAGRKLKVLKVMAIELVGEDLNLTVNQLNAKYSNYFDSTKSTISANRLKSVDKDGIQESTLYLPNVGELRSLPNGVADEIRVSGGKAELVKRVSDTMEELAEPIITPINVSGNLISYPSGTVYVEQVVADAGLYTTKMEILNTELPIKTLDKLSKVDYTTGLEHQLDISKAVVSETSFTHPDLVENDIVFFEYYYDLESTNGNASIEYFDSRYTITDSVTDKIYKWTIAIADGVPSIEIEEV